MSQTLIFSCPQLDVINWTKTSQSSSSPVGYLHLKKNLFTSIFMQYYLFSFLFEYIFITGYSICSSMLNYIQGVPQNTSQFISQPDFWLLKDVCRIQCLNVDVYCLRIRNESCQSYKYLLVITTNVSIICTPSGDLWYG